MLVRRRKRATAGVGIGAFTGIATGLLLGSAALGGCKATPVRPPEGTPILLDAATTKLEPAPTPHVPAPEAKVDAAPARPAKTGPGPTAEAIADDARKQVEDAAKRAHGKDACNEILPLLDVSYSLVRASTPLDERTLGVFASCAAHAHRWRLLRDLADAIAAGERKLETTYFLPRALIGLGKYEAALPLSRATLRAWPTEGEAYDTGALAALRMKDWDGAMKAADQALLLQRKHSVNDDVTALAHALRGAAVLRLGKLEEGLHELDAVKGHAELLDLAGVTAEAAHAAKEKGLLVTVDFAGEAFTALTPLYAKKIAPLGGLVTVTLQNLTDKPMSVMVEAALAGAGAEPEAESETVVKGRPVTVVMTPTWKPGSAFATGKTPEPHELTVSVVGGPDHGTLYRQSAKVTFEPADAMPKVLRSHGEDLRSAFALEAAWVTPTAPAIISVVEAAKGRLHGAKKFEGTAGLSFVQAQALWDELRGRGCAFHRDPSLDSEVSDVTTCRWPREVLEAGNGNALESSVLFASLLEAIGLDVVLVRTPGHRMVGWLGTRADEAARDATPATVKSPRGPAFFVETTTVGEGPFDAAVLRGDAEWVAATNDGLVGSGRAEVEALSELRKRGIAPHVE